MAGDVEFAFKHALVHDTAFATLPRATRRELHGATARVIEESMEKPVKLAGILAHHWREAGDAPRAIAQFRRSVRRAHDVGEHHGSERPRVCGSEIRRCRTDEVPGSVDHEGRNLDPRKHVGSIHLIAELDVGASGPG
ncbi:MAG: hypothetical protein M3O88_01785 [Actinomycetota bacterium]|nr:hypothetical protein [Actinomycetota bacterium]